MKFEPQLKHKRQPQSDIVSVKIPSDLQPQFYALLEKCGGTRGGLIGQMIRFSLSNME